MISKIYQRLRGRTQENLIPVPVITIYSPDGFKGLSRKAFERGELTGSDAYSRGEPQFGWVDSLYSVFRARSYFKGLMSGHGREAIKE